MRPSTTQKSTFPSNAPAETAAKAAAIAEINLLIVAIPLPYGSETLKSSM